MFEKEQLSIGDWILFWIFMAIPIANVVIILVILFSASANRSLKNMIWAQVVLAAVVVGLFLTVLAPFFHQLVELIRMNLSNLPY